MKAPHTLQDAIIYFSDPERAFVYAVNLRWPDQRVICPRCGNEKHSFIKTRRLWFCKGCQKQFTVKVGTIFEDSALGLDKWMTAVWMLVNCKNGVSSYEVARALGITQKSAWFMLQRIRKALQDKSFVKLGGPGTEVEVDETFIGGKARNMHRDKRERLSRSGGMHGGAGKAVVVGVLDHRGRVKTAVLPHRRDNGPEKVVRAMVEKGSEVHTDEFVGYYNLRDGYLHKVVNHLEGYVKENVHTNGIENFWSLLKRGLNGTYVSVEPFHLFRYVDEQAFRFNHRKDVNGRKMDDGARFEEAMQHISGRRLTYAQLTGKNESPRHEPTGAGEAQIPF